jgi:hypothetical protein
MVDFGNLYAGNLNKGSQEQKFNWEALQKNKLLELEAFNQQLARENAFQDQERAVMQDIWKNLAETLKESNGFLAGNAKEFKNVYEQKKQELFKHMSNYTSVQAFMASDGVSHLTKFTEDVLTDQSFKNGIQTAKSYEAYQKSILEGKTAHKLVMTSDGDPLGADNAFRDVISGESSKGIQYRGSLSNNVDVPPPIAGEKDEYYTFEEISQIATVQNPQFFDQEFKDEMNKVIQSGKGKSNSPFLKRFKDPNYDIRRRESDADAELKRAQANYYNARPSAGGGGGGNPLTTQKIPGITTTKVSSEKNENGVEVKAERTVNSVTQVSGFITLNENGSVNSILNTIDLANTGNSLLPSYTRLVDEAIRFSSFTTEEYSVGEIGGKKVSYLKNVNLDEFKRKLFKGITDKRESLYLTPDESAAMKVGVEEYIAHLQRERAAGRNTGILLGVWDPQSNRVEGFANERRIE